MLEESRMDKKSLNRSSPQSRASAIDCKKNTESPHKPWPRNNKKREGSGSALKNEPFRKNVPTQRGRGQVDMRPRPRGGPSNLSMGGTQNTGIEDSDEPEIGSVFVPGSKKQNLNHLLNFMYPIRGNQDRVPERRCSMPYRQAAKRSLHRLDQDLYLRANCQFVVKEDSDYKANLLDPDVPIKWEQVEEIVVRSTGRLECPICLGTPVAGRVGHCGHVYCWPCVLHYAAAHEKQPPPCPVCTTPLQVNNMKPTQIVQWEAPAEEVVMRLVRRLRGSTTVEVAPLYSDLTETVPGVLALENIHNAPYAKFFTASKQQVFEIIKREEQELKNQIMNEIDTSEIVYLEQALELLTQKAEKKNNQYEKPKLPEDSQNIAPTVYEKQLVQESKIDWFDVDQDMGASKAIENQVEELEVTMSQTKLNPDAPDFVQSQSIEVEEFPRLENSFDDQENIKDGNLLDENINDIIKQNHAKYFYFYQAADGQQVFLDNLNVRILKASWGTLAAAPSIIRGRVLQRSTLPLDEQTKKRMPCAAHLPLYCSFDIVELDLKPPDVTIEALNASADELERRARYRARQQRDERRRERIYLRTMEGPPKPDFFSEELFPPAPPSLASPPLADPSPISVVDISPSTSTSTVQPGPSFAKMASTSGIWRVRKPVAPPPPPPPPDEEVEGAAPRSISLSDAIEAALHAAPTQAGKKKKKSKQKVLFATSMQRTA